MRAPRQRPSRRGLAITLLIAISQAAQLERIAASGGENRKSTAACLQWSPAVREPASSAPTRKREDESSNEPDADAKPTLWQLRR
jgi:hypothetical protein